MKTTLLACTAILSAWSSASAQVASGAEGAPAFAIPAPDPVGSVPILQDADAGRLEVLARIGGDLGARYAEPDNEDGLRLDQIIDGSYMAVYDGPTDPVSIANTTFTPPSPVATQPVPQGPEADLMRFAMSPDGLRAMSMMSPDQIKAIAFMAEVMRDPTLAAGTDAAAGRVPGFSQSESPGQVVDVGSGETMALEGWYAGLSGSGATILANDVLPGSEIEVAVGSVVGEFGSVTDIVADGAHVEVRFETGDVIASRAVAAPIGPGVPSLNLADVDLTAPPDEDVVDVAPGEILVSLGHSPTRIRRSVRPPLRPADAALRGAASEAPSLRVPEDGPDPDLPDVPDGSHSGAPADVLAENRTANFPPS